jgi:peptidoglycan pentaglycine glycine transferase (the first glycine)
LKSRFGWDVEYIRADDCGAQVLIRRLPLGFGLAYVPRGPVGEWLPHLLPDLKKVCRQRHCLALKIEPDAAWAPEMADALSSAGFISSPHRVQPQRTLVVDLRGEEEEILARMQQKTRYNIRLASRKGVTVRPWADVPAFARLMQRTARRDGFGAHVPAYYALAYELFQPEGACTLLAAEYEKQILGAIMVFRHGERAWYFYGASSDLERQRMPNHALQWEAMRWARQNECTQYDLWGIPDADAETLEKEFPTRRDGLWGVYRFKRGFGGRLVRTMGAWDLPLMPSLYRLYRIAARMRNGVLQ